MRNTPEQVVVIALDLEIVMVDNIEVDHLVPPRVGPAVRVDLGLLADGRRLPVHRELHVRILLADRVDVPQPLALDAVQRQPARGVKPQLAGTWLLKKRRQCDWRPF